MLRGIPEKKTMQVESNTEIESIEAQAQRRYIEASSRQEEKDSQETSEIKMMARRQHLDQRDEIALDRILGRNDLLPISYLQTGLRMSESVCRIVLRDSQGDVMGFGTGFLVSPEVIITNNHVLPNRDSASTATVEFNYQNDEHFNPCPVNEFSFNPQGFFMTDKRLDFTLVSLHPHSDSGKELKEIPYIQLHSQQGKIIEEEYVSIIQHPEGGLKSITVRENHVKYLFDDFIQYTTDTKHGSSGSPVFNDQWMVVAVHHSGVPDPNRKFTWIANEGIRISSIAAFVKSEYQKADEKTQDIMEGIFMELKELSKKKKDKSDKKKKTEGEKKNQSNLDQWRKGYDPLFLGKDYKVDLPKLSKEMEEDSTRMKDGSNVLDYVHFSVVMCRSRGLAYFTAVNIDGNTCREDIPRIKKWSLDSRISRSDQYGNEVYADNKFDRGHLVRRLDPVWGDLEVARQANADTFYYTNSAPQHEKLNQKSWVGLENYLLHNAQNHGLQISVFTGPIFKEDDLVYREKYRIPIEFWKVVVMVKTDGELSVTAYIQSQQDYMGDLEFSYGAYQTHQVPVELVEELTGLDFGELYKYDPLAKIESSGLLISELANIRL